MSLPADRDLVEFRTFSDEPVDLRLFCAALYPPTTLRRFQGTGVCLIMPLLPFLNFRFLQLSVLKTGFPLQPGRHDWGRKAAGKKRID